MPWEDENTDACGVLVPVDVVGTAGVISSITSNGTELAEDTNPPWNSTTTYATGQRVYSLSTHRVYESLKDGNVGKDPTVPSNRTTAAGVGTSWLEIGPTNRTAMFDGLITTQTSAPGPLVITLLPGAFNSFALFSINADSYSVTVKSAPGADVVYSEPTTPLDASAPIDYYEYFFDPFKPLTQFVRTGVPPYGASEITLTLNKASGNVQLGMIALGDMKPVGIPQRDAEVTPNDFSYVAQDAYGNATVKRRPNSTGMTITTKMDVGQANLVLDAVRGVLGVPVVVVGSQAAMYEWMTVFGLISASMSASDYPYVTLKMTVRGFI